MKTKTRFHKLTAWLLTLAMLMTFIPSFTLGVSAAEITPTEPTLTTDKYDINGDDTMDKVYEITTAGELYWFAGLVNGTLSGVTKNNAANAILMNNITVNENVIVDGALTSDTSSLNVWTAMGKTVFSSGWFGGYFDGNGKTISGLYVNETSSYRGFIGCLGEGGNIKNLTITNSYFASTSNSLGAFVGTMGLESAAENPVIENCKLIDSVVSGTSYVGGIVGGGDYGEIISNCYVYNCTIIGSGDNVGGIAGSAGDYNNEAYIRLCSVNDSSVSGVNNVGGILGKGGRLTKTKISACCNYNTSVTATTKNAGGILGSDAACYSCFVTAEVSAPSKQGPFAGSGNNYSSAYDSDVYGEVINYTSSKAFTTEEIKAGIATYYLTDKTASNTVYVLWGQKLGEDNYPSWNPDSNPDYIVYRDDDPDAEDGYRYYNGDAAASYEPNEDGIYEIANRNDWYKFAKKANEDPTIDGILTDNIDFSAVISDKIKDYRIGEGDAYTGSFDGDGYTIRGLPQMELPLFDTIGSGGELKNLTLSGAAVNYISSAPAVGLVENNNGTVSDCAVSDITIIGSTSSAMIGTNKGTVTNCTATNITVTGKSAAAGIVYLNTGTIEKCNVVSGTVKADHTENYDSHAGGICVRSGAGTIRECSNNADVIAESSSTMIYAAAGIVAAPSDSNGASVQVTKCFNSGDIKGGYAGGISGYDNTSVYVNLSLCYNEGAITGNITGGIAASGSNDSSDKIINCYNVGAVNATSKAGGIAGEQGNCIIENCHNYAKIVSDNIGAPIVGYSSGVWPGPDELINNHAIEGNVDAPTVSSYLDTKGATSNFDAVTKGSTREEFADGTITAKLNAGNSETVWYQYNDYPILEQRHMHKWAYALEGTDTIKAECVNAGCDLTNNSGGSVTIAAPTELVYSGSAMDAECTYDNWLPNKPTIVYNEVDRVNVTGNDITASITLGDATATVDYKIQPREIIPSMVTLSKTSVSYDGNVQTVTVTAKYNSSTTLNADTDYEITGITSATDISTGDGYAVTVTGKGNYIGTVTEYWKINKGSLSTQIELEGWEYLDTPNAPSVTNNPENGEVTYTYYVRAGRGYNQTGSDHGAQTEGGVPIYVGTYYVGAVIAETEHYLETTINMRQYKMFEISPREVTNPTFEGLQATYPYDNGKEIKPTFTLKDDLGNEIPASEYTVNYSNNTDGGEATITISDTEGGNYNISGSKTFRIVTHIHNWNYELDDTDTIKATCSNTDGDCDNTNGGSVTIAAPASLDYTGEAIEAVVTNSLVDKAVAVNVIYTAASGSELTEGKPVKVGTYTASITLGDATAEVTFEIKPAPVVTGIDFNRTSPAYDAATNTFYVSDDFTFDLTVTGEYLTMLENAGGLQTLFYGNAQNAGGAIMGITIESDTSACGSYNIGSLSYAINTAGGGSTYINSIKAGNEWLNVNLKYADLYELKINESENGKVSHGRVIGNMVAEHTEVILTVTPNTGYELDTLTVDGQNVTAQVSGGKYTFTMPAEDVEVSATFKALPHKHDWKVTENGNVITATCVGTLGECPNRTSTITLVAPENLVYNGSEKVVTTSGTIDGVTIPDVQYTGNRVNAGTFTASLTIDNATATLDVTITPKSISGAVIVLDNNANLVYTGNTITPDVASVTLDGTTLIKDTDYTVSYSDNTNAGQATVTVTGKGNYKDTANANFTIEKATPVVTAPTAKAGLAYTGQAQELVNAGSTTGGTMQYSLDNATYSANIPTATNAGTYTVYYKVAGGNNYNDVAASSVEVTIGKQTVNKPTIESKEYTGTELTADVPASELYTVSQEAQTETGEYDVTLTLKDTTNCKWADTDEASVTLKFNITAATNSWKTEPSISGWTFGQTASTPSYEAKFGNGNVKVEYKKAEESAYTTTVPTNAGNYTARFGVAATNNYGALEKTVDFTITKAQAVISVDTTPIEKFYSEAWELPTATTNFGTVTGDKTVAEMSNVGEYTVTYTVAGDNNFNGATKTVNVTINPKSVTGATVGAFAELTYTGAAQTPSATVTIDNLIVTGAWSDVTNVADKTTFTASGNFTGMIADVDVGMKKATPMFAPESTWTARIPAGRELSQANASFAESLGVDGNPITGSYEWKTPDKVISDKGDYTEKVVFTPEDENYAPIELDAAVECYIPRSGGLSAGGDKGTSGKDNLGTPSDDKADEVDKPDEKEEDDTTPPSDDTDKTESTFTDVAPAAWYGDAVEWMNKKGYMSGTGNGKFSPNLPTTRGMVVTVLWRIAGKPAPQGECTFQDVKAGSYYEDAIAWAQENGVVTGHSDTVFAPDELITREQLATIIHRNEKRLGNDVSHFNDLEHFVDDHHVSDWALEAKQWAVGAGIISGTSATTLHPKKEATRAETAAILYRMNNK
ncbi:MAG: S-layer homology domain-containing protein [Oscillospiraceae bacterium]|nr:S-layer homology domain-containing protein [Oscillospiraceae bacterium]